LTRHGEVAGRALVVHLARALHAVASVSAPVQPAGRRAFFANSLLPVLGGKTRGDALAVLMACPRRRRLIEGT